MAQTKWAVRPHSYTVSSKYGLKNQPIIRRTRLLQTPLFSIYLHHILKPDVGYSVHDHPWTFVTCILRGGYTEEIHFTPATDFKNARQKERHRFSWHKMPMRYAHRVCKVKPNTTTLVFIGRKRQDFGFWGSYNGSYTPWDKYIETTSPDPFDS
jgi:hypothetical protein